MRLCPSDFMLHANGQKNCRRYFKVINILFDDDILHSIHLHSISKPETKRLVGGQSQ